MYEIPSSSDYLQAKKKKLLNSMQPNKLKINFPIHTAPTVLITNMPLPLPVVPQQEKKTGIDLDKILFSNKYIVLLNRYNRKFLSGKYDELTNKLTRKKVNKLIYKINKIVPDNELVAHKIIKIYVVNLNLIVNHLHLNAKFKNTKEHLESLEMSTGEILGNRGKLLQYLNEMSSPSLVSLEITAPLLNIRHEYLEYHRRYGVPENLNYDLGKLNKIIEDHCIV
jgi:hypothetical protein